nr:hypothetical protein [Tanacetum cinerariifolium]
MLHICLRVHGQSFVEPPFEEEILTFIRFLGYSAVIRNLTDVNINKLYQPWRSFAAIINKCVIRKSSGYDSLRLSQAQILWGLYHKRNVNYAYLMWEDFVYQVEYKDHKKSNEMHFPRFIKVISIISCQRIRLFQGGTSALMPIELTNEEIRNSNAYKEYYAVATGAAPPKTKTSVQRTRSSFETTITPLIVAAGPRLTTSQKGKQAAKLPKPKEVVRNDDKDDEKDDQEEGGDDEHEYVEEEYNEETKDEESFDPISKTPKNSDDEGNGDEDLGLNIGGEERHVEVEEEDELYRDININQGREMELKKILIEKMEGNKSIQRSDEQRNLYKALIEDYESDKIILDTYGETVTLKRHRDDEVDKDEEPSAGPDRGSKRRREGKEPESASAPIETATRSADRSTQRSQSRHALASAEDQPIVQSSQHPEWFSQQQKPPSPDRDWNKTVPATHGSIQPWISELMKLSDSRSSFNELMDNPLDFFNVLINRLKVDTLNQELLASPTYELMKGSCKSLVEVEYHLEEVFKATIDQLDWVNPEGKLTNLTVEERFAFNVSLRMFTRSIVIQRYVEDLQLGVESYQKKLNLTKPDSYRSDLKHKEAYNAYSNPRGFIYQNKDKKNRLMRIDELHKFNDGMLTDVRTALDDRLKGIRMQYLPQSIWRKCDKDRAAAMIQATD